MDHGTDSGVPSPSTIVGVAVTPQERPRLNTPCQSERGGTMLLQLLEFKTHLLEAVQELHIRREATARFEIQISKVVLEKQEIEWEKDSLQRQIETATKEHAESLINVKKQAKIRNMEEDKGKYQFISELKDKEISNLKEELKSLQLLKYNFEKKSNELEQKQALQNRSKDSHLIQIGEVEKRFGTLSRQCATLKKAHEQLGQNVDEAMKRNKKLKATNEKHEATIQKLMKELEEVYIKLVKTKLSSVRHDTSTIMTVKDQHLNQLSYKLSMEKEMNKKLQEEYAALRSEKQEAMTSLQHTQQLFLNQTQAVNRLGLQLQTQEEQYKALKQEHEAMQEKVAELMSEQQHFQALKEVHDDLQQKYNGLSAQVKMQAQKIQELEMFPNLAEGTRERPLDEPKSSLTQPVFGSLQSSAVSQSKILDCLEDTTAKTKLDGEMGGTPELFGKCEIQLQVQCEEPFSIRSPKKVLGLLRTMDNDDTVVNKHKCTSSTSGQLSSEVSDVTCTTSANELAISESIVDEINISNSDNMSSHYLLTNNRNSVQGKISASGTDCSGMDKVNNARNNTDKEHRSESHLSSAEDVLEERCTGEQRETVFLQTADSGNSQEHGKIDAHKTETTKITAQFRDAEKKGGQTETEEAQTTCDPKITSPSDVDFVDISEKISIVCEADCYQKDTEKATDHSSVSMTEEKLLYDLNSSPDQSLHNKSILIVQEAQCSSQVEVQTNAETVKSSPIAPYPLVEKITEVTRLEESTVNVGTTSSDLHSLSADSVKNQAMREPIRTISNVTPTDEMSGTNTNEMFKKTIVDTKVECHNMGASEPANGLMEVFESDTHVETCEMTPQAEPVISDGDFNTISDTDITEDSHQPKSGEFPEVSTSKCKLQPVVKDVSNPDIAVDSNSESVLLGSEQPKDGETSEVETSTCQKEPGVKEALGDVKHLSLPKLKTYRLSFDWGAPMKQTVLATITSDSNLQPNVQKSPVSEQNASASHEILTQSHCTFLKSQPSKEPFRASDLLKASSVSASTGFGRKHKMGEWNVCGEGVRETVVTDESRVPLSAPSCQVSNSSSTWHSGIPLPTVAPRFDAELEPLCSQEQSSFRSQISKIEEFLKSETFHLSKRPRTDH
ncbi:coiled-coil domain-containing protein 73 isoform X2 [Syngnathus scovelli]|uniref:coiled-coil domain-containing protein 73 isoform X2 n=1 Tax=Syngnathus scovelli TaxID=161590 RepID=UPI0021109DBE|nr:coiled-coil domain-containing protein 73-like isoform X2 [Syngnathus scovelli]